MATQVLPPDRQAAARTGILTPLDATHDNPSWGWTAGAGISTAEDLARYAQALVGGGLLNDAMQRQRLARIRPINPADPKSAGYGLALARFGPVFGHTGELPGYNSFMGHDPRRSITIIVWSSLAAVRRGQRPEHAVRGRTGSRSRRVGPAAEGLRQPGVARMERDSPAAAPAECVSPVSMVGSQPSTSQRRRTGQ
jgi:CubicO group peptidase (beta-lactamase class C family)